MQKSEKEKYEKKIRKLKENIKKLEEEKEKRREDGLNGEGKASATEVLRSLGRMIGLSGVIKSAEKLPEFQERIKMVDEELKRKLRTTPMKKTEGNIPYRARGFRTISSTEGKPGLKKVTLSPQEREVDIFDEEDYVLAIIEFPGADEKSIKLNLENDKLTIIADKSGKKYYKEIILPCVPAGEITKNYKNGILEVRLKKM